MPSPPEHAELEQICQELLAIARRIEQGRAPSIQQVRDRLAYLLDGVIELLAAGSNMQIAAITVGESNEQGICLVSASRRIQDALKLDNGSELFEPIRMWCRETMIKEAISRRLGGQRVFDPHNVTDVIGPDLAALFTQYGSEISGLDSIASHLNDYEDSGPPHSRPSFLDDSKLMASKWMPPESLSDEDAIRWVMADAPIELINIGTTKLRSLGGIQRIATWFDTEPFMEANSSLAIGGINGLRVGALVVLKLARCGVYIKENQLSPDQGYLHHSNFRPFGNAMIEQIVNAINVSVLVLSPTVERRSVSGLPQIPFHPLPSRSQATENHAISDPAQSQTTVNMHHLDLPAATSMSETIEVEDSVDPQSDAQEQPIPPEDRGLGEATGDLAQDSEEERSRIPLSQKVREKKDLQRIFSSDSEEGNASKKPPQKKAKKESSKQNAAPKLQPEVVIKQEKGTPSVKAGNAVRPKLKVTPSDPDSIFRRKTINIDDMMHEDDFEDPVPSSSRLPAQAGTESPIESTKSQGKRKAKAGEARGSPVFEAPQAEEPVFRKIDRSNVDRAPPAGKARRTASTAGSVAAGGKRVTRSKSVK